MTCPDSSLSHQRLTRTSKKGRLLPAVPQGPRSPSVSPGQTLVRAVAQQCDRFSKCGEGGPSRLVSLRESTSCFAIWVFPQEYPTLTTFFEGEIISRKHPFLTRKWDADEDVDRKHWVSPAPAPPSSACPALVPRPSLRSSLACAAAGEPSAWRGNLRGSLGWMEARCPARGRPRAAGARSKRAHQDHSGLLPGAFASGPRKSCAFEIHPFSSQLSLPSLWLS